MRFAELAGSAAHLWIGGAVLALLVGIVLGLVARTALAIARGEICLPE
jgi:tellurite resistance protein